MNESEDFDHGVSPRTIRQHGTQYKIQHNQRVSRTRLPYLTEFQDQSRRFPEIGIFLTRQRDEAPLLVRKSAEVVIEGP